MPNGDDHDALIELGSTVRNLSLTIEAHNIASVERDTRIETKLERVAADVERHSLDLFSLNSRPIMPVETEEARALVIEHREMWSAYRLGRWVVTGAIAALLAQSAALLVLVISGAVN